MSYIELYTRRPVKFESGGQFVSDGEWSHPVRTIGTHLILLGIKGSAYIYCGKTQYELCRGDVLFLPAGIEHGGYKISNNVSFFWMHFLPSKMQGQFVIYSSEPLALPLQEYFTRLPDYMHSLESERLIVMASQLLSVYDSSYANKEYQDFVMTCFLFEVGEQYQTLIHNKSQQEDTGLYKICEWIRIHADKQISLSHVAEQFAYNKNYLSRIFKQHTGTTVQEYINRIKISNAKQLLCTTNKSIKEIAYLVGFSDDKYMIRRFTLQESVSPTQFRHAFNRTHMNKK